MFESVHVLTADFAKVISELNQFQKSIKELKERQSQAESAAEMFSLA